MPGKVDQHGELDHVVDQVCPTLSLLHERIVRSRLTDRRLFKPNLTVTTWTS